MSITQQDVAMAILNKKPLNVPWRNPEPIKVSKRGRPRKYFTEKEKRQANVQYSRTFREKNPEKYSVYHATYNRHRYQTDSIYREKVKTRSREYNAKIKQAVKEVQEAFENEQT